MRREENDFREQVRRVIADEKDFETIWDWADYILDDNDSLQNDAEFMIGQIDYEIDQFNSPYRGYYI